MFSASHFHPMLVHFPIALILIAFIAEAASFIYKKEYLSMAGYWLLVFGALSAIAAYLAGQFFTGEMDGSAGEIRENHELFATITLILILCNAILQTYLKFIRKDDRQMKWLTFSFSALSAAAVSVTGFYGGVLVYNYMMPL